MPADGAKRQSGTPYPLMSSNPNSHPTQFAELNELLGQFVAKVERILGYNFVGACLQGSVALGDADLYSDCDFLVVTCRTLTPAQERGVCRLHTRMRTWPNHWASHIEGSYAPQDDLRSLAGLGRKRLFVDQGPTR